MSWKTIAAESIKTPTLPAATDPVAGGDLTLACALRVKLDRGEIAPSSRHFAESLYQGYKRYGSFTDKQRPHVLRLVSESANVDPMSLADKDTAEALRGRLADLSDGDRRFAESMLSGFDRYGSFTDKQRPYARKLAERLPAETSAPVAPVAAPAPSASPAAPARLQCPNISQIVSLNGFARFTVGDLKLSLKNDGSLIWVKWQDRIAGRIENGEYIPSHRYLSNRLLDACRAELERIEQNPLEAAKQNGVMTGRCSCCGRPLTDPVSIGFGIGPICRAKGWGIEL